MTSATRTCCSAISVEDGSPKTVGSLQSGSERANNQVCFGKASWDGAREKHPSIVSNRCLEGRSVDTDSHVCYLPLYGNQSCLPEHQEHVGWPLTRAWRILVFDFYYFIYRMKPFFCNNRLRPLEFDVLSHSPSFLSVPTRLFAALTYFSYPRHPHSMFRSPRAQSD